MEQIKKIKVAWICHFSNKEVRKRLPLSDRPFFNLLKKIFGEKKKTVHADFAPWVNNLILEFEKIQDIELHIIAPHKGLKKLIVEFERNNIHYHFFKPDNLLILNRIIDRFYKKRQAKFWINRYLVKNLIKKINPDIINLIGAENPYYSITALDIENIPLYVSAQTVYSNPDWLKYSGSINQLNLDVELKIHQKATFFGCMGRMHRDLILRNNPDAIIFKMFFPIQRPAEVKEVPKTFDFIFFASGVSQHKGIEDAMEALALVKKEKPDVSLNVVGKCSPNYKFELLRKLDKLNLKNNVSFNEYFPVHNDMYQHVKKGRIALLPIKLDVISTTVIEAILLEIPVVTYKTSGTPYLNKDEETILLADIGDVGKLAENMLLLLNNPEKAEQLKKAAKAFVEREFENKTSALRLVENYKAVIENYYYGTPIPEGLLFNTEEFPVY